MTVTWTPPERAATLIAPDGTSVSVVISSPGERVVGQDDDGTPIMLLDVDLVADVQLAVPGRYMIETPGGQTLELAVV